MQPYLVFISICVAGLVIRNFFPSYLGQKGKNLATKEDLKEITKISEAVKAEYSQLLEQLKANNQLLHSSIERKQNLKKEVLMEGIEALTLIPNIFGKYSDLGNSDTDINKELSVQAARLSKANAVGDLETVNLLREFSDSVGEATIRIILDRYPLLLSEAEIKSHQVVADMAKDKMTVLANSMSELSINGGTQSARDAMERQYNFHKSKFDEMTQKVSELREAQFSRTRQFSRHCVQKTLEIQKQSSPLVVAFRKELDLEVDADEYMKGVEEQCNKIFDVYSAAMDQFEEEHSP